MSDISRNNFAPQSETVEQTSVKVPKNWIDSTIKLLTVRLAQGLAKITWITPNFISWVSALLGGLVAGGLIYKQQFLWAVPCIILSGILDNLDGDLARERGMTSKEGEILDSVLDRYVDFCLISALILVSPEKNLVPGLLALLGGSLVPYIRARSEAAGKSTVATIGDRVTRTILIILGLLTHQIFPLLIVLAIISNIGAIHRFIVALMTDESVNLKP